VDQFIVPLTLLANGIGAGVMFSTVIGLAPLSLALPYENYVRTIQFLWKRYDPFMPITNGIAFLLDLTLVLTVAGPAARVFCGVAALLLATVMTISVVKNVPINRYVMSLDPRTPPDDWARVDPRTRWRKWNLIRTVCVLLALGANLAAVAVILGKG
jgi:uncharacterized membrane protein